MSRTAVSFEVGEIGEIGEISHARRTGMAMSSHETRQP